MSEPVKEDAPQLVVPSFNGFSEGKPKMGAVRRRFYQQHFLPGILNGSPVDIQGQRQYGDILLYDLLEEWRTDPLEARRKLELFIGAYKGSDLPSGAKDLLADFHYVEGNFQAGYDVPSVQLCLSTYLNLTKPLGHLPLKSWQIIHWSGGGLTQKGMRKHLRAIMQILQERLDSFHAEYGVSIIEDFWNRFTAERPLEEVALDIEGDVSSYRTGGDVRHYLVAVQEAESEDSSPMAFEGWEGYEEPIQWPAPWIRLGPNFPLLYARFRVLAREAENAARDAARVPRVGERWVSEMTLLREIEAAFPNERVMHQARPGWLMPQSLDIYLPEHNVGIEYQGAQHSRPVSLFGGDEAYEVQQERDARKAGLCLENDCALIEVHPGYQRQVVIEQVAAAIQRTKEGVPFHESNSGEKMSHG